MLYIGTLTGSALLDVLAAFTISWGIWTCVVYRRLSHIPGPTTWGLSVWPLFRLHQNGDIYHGLAKLCDQYGPLVRIAPNTLLTSDADLVRRMNTPRSPYTRADWYLAMRLVPGEDNVLSVVTDKEHDDRRKKMAAGYAGKENTTLERDLDECIMDLCRLIDTRYAIDADDSETPSKPMDLARKIQFLTSDIMSKITLDAKFHDLRDDNDNFGYIHEIETMFPRLFCTSCIPKVIRLFTNIGLMKMFEPTAQAQFGFGKILAITREQVGKRFDAEKNVILDKPDMLGSFLRHGLTREQAEQESVVQLVAGSDTAATGMRSTLFNLISNPKAYSKLMAELDAAVADDRIPASHDKVIPNTVALELPYLQACIKEGIRWLSPIAGMLSKQTPPEGDTIHGYFVPGGVAIAWSTKAIHHNKKLYGPDEQAFRPDRWIHTSEGGDEPSTEKIGTMERNNDLIFGHGKYSCLGKSVAVIELNKVFCELLRRFEFSLMKPEEGWRGGACFGIFLQKGLWVTVRRREARAR